MVTDPEDFVNTMGCRPGASSPSTTTCELRLNSQHFHTVLTDAIYVVIWETTVSNHVQECSDFYQVSMIRRYYLETSGRVILQANSVRSWTESVGSVNTLPALIEVSYRFTISRLHVDVARCLSVTR